MNRIITKVMLASFTLASSYLYADVYDFKPGLWESTHTMEIIEIDAPPEVEKMIRDSMKGEQPVETECIENGADMFELTPEDVGCKNSLKYINSNKAEFESVCSSPDGEIKTAGEVIFKGKTLTLLAESTTSNGGVTMKLKGSSAGKYIGSCN